MRRRVLLQRQVEQAGVIDPHSRKEYSSRSVQQEYGPIRTAGVQLDTAKGYTGPIHTKEG
jgi:hypothetical protein